MKIVTSFKTFRSDMLNLPTRYLQQLVGGATLNHADVVDILEDGGHGLVPGPGGGLPGEVGGQLGEEGEDDDEDEDPPAAGDQPGGVGLGAVGGASEPAGGEVPGGVRHQQRGVVGGGPGEEGEDQAGEEVEQEDHHPDPSGVRAEPGAGPGG